MQARTLEITADSEAPPEQVWALLADVDTWSQWGGFDEATPQYPATPTSTAWGRSAASA